MSFEQPNNELDTKLVSYSDEQVEGMMKDPLDVISTDQPGQVSVFAGIPTNEIRQKAGEEAVRRGLVSDEQVKEMMKDPVDTISTDEPSQTSGVTEMGTDEIM